jgi:hypothetical protein
MQRALMQFFKPENWFAVREAMLQAGRQDLIGNGCDCLIPANPPKEALDAKRAKTNQHAQGEEAKADHYHAVANPTKGERRLTRGYRPGRKTQKRRKKRKPS